MRAVVIFNPTARGHQAPRRLAALRARVPAAALRPTSAPGSASTLASEACREGFDVVIAAGGDGTVSEVVDGIASVPGALETVRLGVVPLGTINVFARELGLPQEFDRAWQVIKQGREQRVDLPRVEFTGGADRRPRHFVQLAGCGLDARAIAMVNLGWKRRIGPLAYGLAVLGAMRGVQPRVRVQTGGQSLEGELVVVGNGRFYGGEVTTFPQADLHDGVLDARIFPRVTLLTFLRFGLSWLGRRPLSRSVAAEVRANRIELTSTVPVPVQADGDNVGTLPACFTVQRQALRVLAPSAGCPA